MILWYFADYSASRIVLLCVNHACRVLGPPNRRAIHYVILTSNPVTVTAEVYPREVTVRPEGRLVSLLAPRPGRRRSRAPGLLEVSPSGSSLPFLNILLPTCIATHALEAPHPCSDPTMKPPSLSDPPPSPPIPKLPPHTSSPLFILCASLWACPNSDSNEHHNKLLVIACQETTR